jgi:hypothetical protein
MMGPGDSKHRQVRLASAVSSAHYRPADKSEVSAMPRGASFHLKPMLRPGASHAHNTRGWSADHPEPGYLLPEEHRLGAWREMAAGDVQATHAKKLAEASPKAVSLAKVGKYSPVWEGVLNLADPGPPRPDYAGQVRWFCEGYERITGHKVLAADIHLDEGRFEGGRPIYNAHAHVAVDRTDERGRPIQVNRQQLRQIQDLAAEATSLERGTDARETRRKHLDHGSYRALAKRGAIRSNAELDQDIREWEAVATIAEIESAGRAEAEEKLLATLQKLEAERSKAAQLDAVQKALELAQIDLDGARRQRDEANRQLRTVDRDRETAEAYGELRGLMKASGQATQQDYVEARQKRQDRDWLQDQVGTWSERAEAARKAQDAALVAERKATAEMRTTWLPLTDVPALIASLPDLEARQHALQLEIAQAQEAGDHARAGAIQYGELLPIAAIVRLRDAITDAAARVLDQLGLRTPAGAAAEDQLAAERDQARAEAARKVEPADLRVLAGELRRSQTKPQTDFSWQPEGVRALTEWARQQPTQQSRTQKTAGITR